MTSFYGGAAISTVSLTGTETAPIILNKIEDGTYTIDGSYKLSDLDNELNDELSNKSVTVETDTVTGNKAITYTYISDGNAYIKVINFNEDGTYSEKDELLSANPVILIDDGDEVAALKY
jgi:hypothetical protein